MACWIIIYIDVHKNIVTDIGSKCRASLLKRGAFVKKKKKGQQNTHLFFILFSVA